MNPRAVRVHIARFKGDREVDAIAARSTRRSFASREGELVRTTYDLTDEPRDADLRALLRWCGAEAALAQLVLRDHLGQGASIAG